MSFQKLIQSKTFWLGVSTIAAAAVSWYMKALPPEQAVAGIIGGLALIFTRQAIEKSGPNGGDK